MVHQSESVDESASEMKPRSELCVLFYYANEDIFIVPVYSENTFLTTYLVSMVLVVSNTLRTTITSVAMKNSAMTDHVHCASDDTAKSVLGFVIPSSFSLVSTWSISVTGDNGTFIVFTIAAGDTLARHSQSYNHGRFECED